MRDWKKPYIFEFFTPEELLSPTGLKQFDNGNLLIQPDFFYRIAKWRKEEGVPFTINNGYLMYRGYRSPVENGLIGGATFSRHMQGIACDLTIKGYSVAQMAEAATARGFYVIPYHDKEFIHVDDRPKLK